MGQVFPTDTTTGDSWVLFFFLFPLFVLALWLVFWVGCLVQETAQHEFKVYGYIREKVKRLKVGLRKSVLV